METNPTFEAYIRQLLTQIINEAVENAIGCLFPALMVPQLNQNKIMDLKWLPSLTSCCATLRCTLHNRAIPDDK